MEVGRFRSNGRSLPEAPGSGRLQFLATSGVAGQVQGTSPALGINNFVLDGPSKILDVDIVIFAPGSRSMLAAYLVQSVGGRSHLHYASVPSTTQRSSLRTSDAGIPRITRQPPHSITAVRPAAWH